MHFAHAHGQDVTEKDFFSDARNFVQPPYVYDVKTSVRKAVLEKIANNLGLQFKRSSTKVDLMKIIWACLLFDSGNNGQPASDS